MWLTKLQKLLGKDDTLVFVFFINAPPLNAFRILTWLQFGFLFVPIIWNFAADISHSNLHSEMNYGSHDHIKTLTFQVLLLAHTQTDASPHVSRVCSWSVICVHALRCCMRSSPLPSEALQIRAPGKADESQAQLFPYQRRSSGVWTNLFHVRGVRNAHRHKRLTGRQQHLRKQGLRLIRSHPEASSTAHIGSVSLPLSLSLSWHYLGNKNLSMVL